MNQDTSSDKPRNGNSTPIGAAKALFIGNIQESLLFPYPRMQEEQIETVRMIIDSLDKFLGPKEKDFRKMDKDGEQPKEYIESLKELGLFGLIIGEEYGGIGLSNSAYSRVVQQTTRHDASTTLTVAAHSSIGMKGILLFGNDQQKKKYLPKLASGETIAAFCLTEPGAGSDAASIKTHATKNSDGTWTLNGEKIWITNGGIAGVYTVFARTDSEQGKISAFIVEREWQGVSTGPKEDKMGIRASATNAVIFNNVKVPAENLLGEEGKGFKVAMSILNNGRTGLGGGCIGAMKTSIAMATKQAKERKQFGRSISEFALVKDKIAQMAVNCFATESVVYMVGHLIDSGSDDFSVEAAISKVFASEALWTVANEALQIAGGNGYMKELPYERIVRDSRINMIFEGTNEILRLYIALSGMKDAGEYFKDISKSIGGVLNDPIKGFGVLSTYATKKLSQYTPLGHTPIQAVAPQLAEEAQSLQRYTAQLAKTTEDSLRRLGKGVVGQQFLMKRLSDVATDIFVGLCVISRVTRYIKEKGAEQCTDELAMAKIFVRQAKRRINQNLRRVDKNEDDTAIALADSILEKDGYTWDVI